MTIIRRGWGSNTRAEESESAADSLDYKVTVRTSSLNVLRITFNLTTEGITLGLIMFPLQVFFEQLVC